MKSDQWRKYYKHTKEDQVQRTGLVHLIHVAQLDLRIPDVDCKWPITKY